MMRSTRWLETGGPDDADLCAALHDARRGPSAEQLTDLSARLAQHFATQGSAPAVAHGRPTRARKRSILIVLGLGLVLLALSWSRSATQHATPVSAERAARTPAAVPVAEVPKVSPLSVPAAAQPANEIEVAAPINAKAVATAARTRLRRAAPATVRPPHAADDEVGLLQRAQRALLARPALALALADDHQRLFPAGLFTEEREAITIEALQRLQRSAEADARRQAFYRRYPHSTYRQRLEQLPLTAP